MKFLSIILLLLFTSSLNAQTWQNLTNGDWIYDITEDDTHLWLGTNGGLVRMDKSNMNSETFTRAKKQIPDNNVLALEINDNGLWMGSRFSGLGLLVDDNCTIYNSYNTNLISDQQLTAIQSNEDDDIIYVGSLGYVSKFDGISFEIIKEMDPLAPFENIYDIEIDNSGNVWIASSSGLYEYDGTETVKIHEVIGSISSIIFDNQGNTWASSNHGLYKFSDGIWTCFNTNNSNLITDNLSKMAIDAENNLWIASQDYLIEYSQSTGFTNYDCFAQGIGNFNIFTIYIDNEGRILIGTRNNGLLLFEDGNFSKIPINSASVLPSNNVNYLQSNGKMWFGYENGLFDLEGISFDTLNSNLPYPEVYLLSHDNNGIIWLYNRLVIYTPSGAVFHSKIVKFNGTDFEEFETPFSSSQQIKLKVDNQNVFWFLVPYQGVFKWDGNSWITYNMNNSPISSDLVNVIDFDSRGNIWIGQNSMWDDEGHLIGGGLLMFDGNDSWTKYDVHNSGLPYNSVSAIEIDQNDVVWIGTDDGSGLEGGGLTRFDGETWHSYKKNNSEISDNQIISIIEDSEGDIWCGSKFGGLIKFDKGNNWEIFTKQNSGIASDYVFDLVEDGTQIWMRHDIYSGISIFDKNSTGLVDMPQNDVSVEIYPNPIVNHVVIKSKFQNEKIQSVKLFDLSGKIVYQKKYADGSSEVTIGKNIFNRISNGVLILEIRAKNTISIRKIIVL